MAPSFLPQPPPTHKKPYNIKRIYVNTKRNQRIYKKKVLVLHKKSFLWISVLSIVVCSIDLSSPLPTLPSPPPEKNTSLPHLKNSEIPKQRQEINAVLKMCKKLTWILFPISFIRPNFLTIFSTSLNVKLDLICTEFALLCISYNGLSQLKFGLKIKIHKDIQSIRKQEWKIVIFEW